ncbi:mucin-2-like [Triticum urartu]|uniref:mucin-2-like n=1 Tax=Triticum urartu TaxID=4572 RepID=UPI002043111E|nr:mucin-2-like [Triticum urartu]
MAAPRLHRFLLRRTASTTSSSTASRSPALLQDRIPPTSSTTPTLTTPCPPRASTAFSSTVSNPAVTSKPAPVLTAPWPPPSLARATRPPSCAAPLSAICFSRPAAAGTTSPGRWDADWARFSYYCPRSSRNNTIGLGARPSAAPSLQVQFGRRPSALWPPTPLLCSALWPPAMLLCSTAIIVGQEPGFIHVFPRLTEPHLLHCLTKLLDM